MSGISKYSSANYPKVAVADNYDAFTQNKVDRLHFIYKANIQKEEVISSADKEFYSKEFRELADNFCLDLARGGELDGEYRMLRAIIYDNSQYQGVLPKLLALYTITLDKNTPAVRKISERGLGILNKDFKAVIHFEHWRQGQANQKANYVQSFANFIKGPAAPAAAKVEEKREEKAPAQQEAPRPPVKAVVQPKVEQGFFSKCWEDCCKSSKEKAQ